jgi:hypothetical protein
MQVQKTTITFTHDIGFDIHEALCKAIHEHDQDALDGLLNNVYDVGDPEKEETVERT